MNAPKLPPKVLIVEDDSTSADLVSAIISKLGISPVIAADADQARSSIAAEQFDLIIMDINIPGATGLELCAEVRKKEKGTSKRTLVVALTGMDSPDARKICLDAGMDGYFSKPIDRLKLHGFIKNLFKVSQ